MNNSGKVLYSKNPVKLQITRNVDFPSIGSGSPKRRLYFIPHALVMKIYNHGEIRSSLDFLY